MPRITLQLDEGMVHAIEVRIDSCGPHDRLIASLPMSPLPLASMPPGLLEGIELSGTIVSEQLRKRALGRE